MRQANTLVDLKLSLLSFSQCLCQSYAYSHHATGTTQVCLFRDSFDPITTTGYSIYGLSSDSTKANTTFKAKQKLPYTLLCDPAQTLISSIGFKKQPKGTIRGVFVVDKEGKVLASESGGPAKTLEVVRKLVNETENGATKEAVKPATTAAEVADAGAEVDDK